MKCLSAFTALFLLWTAPARADCFPAQAAVRNLIENSYVPVAFFERDHAPAVIFAGPGGAWLEFIMPDDGTFCLLDQGRGFVLVPEPKA